jgi:FkbM family methyltransferase
MPYDTICKEILIEGLYEKSIIHGMCQLIKNKDCTVLDVGANIGNHSMYFAGVFDQVISFEPSERNNWIFKANVELNNLSNVRLISKGLSDSAGFIELGNDGNKFDTNNGFDSKAQLSPSKLNQRMIEIAIGDDEVELLGLSKNIGMIKIDVEGLEPKVIRGLARTIAGHKPLIFWEAFDIETINESRVILEQLGIKHFYHLTPLKALATNKLQRLLSGADCTLVPLDLATIYSGMNVASFEDILEA